MLRASVSLSEHLGGLNPRQTQIESKIQSFTITKEKLLENK